MRIVEKIVLLFLPTFMLSVVSMALLSRQAAEQVLIQGVARTGRALHLDLDPGPETVAALRVGDADFLLPHLQRLGRRAGAVYAFVLGPDGRVLAHTDAGEIGKTYDDEATRSALAAREPLQRELTLAEGRIMDISQPLWEVGRPGQVDLQLGAGGDAGGRRLGTVRLGLPLGEVLDAADRISKQVLWIVTGINVLATGLVLLYLRRVLQPVGAMAMATERIASGHFGESVPVLSRDEMGELAHSFNRMSQELATTTVSVDFLDSILSNMRDVLIVTNADGSVRRVNRAALELLGYQEGDVIGRSARHLFASGDEHLFDAESVIDLERGEEFRARETSMIPSDGVPIPVIASVAPFHDRDGGRAGFIVTATDITDRKGAERRLRRSLEDKEVLLREIHHRVKNNLQIVSSLLNLQASRVADPDVRQMYADSQRRVQSMALIHEKLYLSEDLARVDLADYLHSLTMALLQSYGCGPHEVRIELDVAASIRLGIDHAIPCGLVVNELVSNCLKHAFPDRGGTVSVTVASSEGGQYRLEVTDDGCGMPADVDPASVDSLGLKLVSILVRQLAGHLEVGAGPGGVGTRFRVDFGVAGDMEAPVA